MNYILETERLRLKKLETNDTEFLIELMNSPGWLQYIGDRNIHTEEQALAYIVNGPMKSYDTNGFGLSRVELKSDSTPIGICGILKRESLDHPDLGFAFLPEFMGQGYAIEIAKATLDHARDLLQLPTILAITIPGNIRSISLLKKLGFTIVSQDESLITFRYN